jgi:hypothetical protein
LRINLNFMGNRGQVEALFFLDHNHNPVNNVAQSHDFTQERQKTRPDPHDSLRNWSNTGLSQTPNNSFHPIAHSLRSQASGEARRWAL